MAQKTLEQKVADAEARARRLKAALGEQKHAQDTRRKIILGGVVLSAMETDENLKAQVVALLRERVTRPADVEAMNPWLSTT